SEVPRQRPHHLSRARSTGDRLRVRGCIELRGYGDGRAGARRARLVSCAVSSAHPGAHQRSHDALFGATHRLRPAQHIRAARPRTLQLSLEPGKAHAGEMMSFLAPLFFLGLGAIAIPVLVHLIQRERKRVVEFPSLMFVQRIPYQSVRRRRIRHWYLLAMRAAAIALIVAAFARPFFTKGAAASAVAASGTREVVILLDQSASMAYGDHWTRAR